MLRIEKINIILFATILIFSLTSKINSNDQNMKTDWEIDGLKGKVKEWICIGKFWKEVTKYNNKGKAIEYLSFGTDNIIKTRLIYKKDKEGNRLIYNTDNIYLGKEVFKYDLKGNLIEKTSLYSDDSMGSKTINKYNKEGKLVESQYLYIEKGQKYPNIIEKSEYEYDLLGNISETSIYASGNTLEDIRLIEIMKHKYDKNNRNVETIPYRSDGTRYGKIVYEYDKKGNRIKYSQYDEIKKNGKIELEEVSHEEYQYTYWK